MYSVALSKSNNNLTKLLGTQHYRFFHWLPVWKGCLGTQLNATILTNFQKIPLTWEQNAHFFRMQSQTDNFIRIFKVLNMYVVQYRKQYIREVIKGLWCCLYKPVITTLHPVYILYYYKYNWIVVTLTRQLPKIYPMAKR